MLRLLGAWLSAFGQYAMRRGGAIGFADTPRHSISRGRMRTDDTVGEHIERASGGRIAR